MAASPSASSEQPMNHLEPLATALFEGDAAAAQEILAQAQTVNDQRMGRCDGRPGIESWTQGTIDWAQSLKAKFSVVSTLSSKRRAVLELSLEITVDDAAVDLPYVLVAELKDDAISEVRTYHSTWPYTGTHVFRAPPLAGTPGDPVPTIFSSYIDRVSNADVDKVLTSFTPDGYVQEPSGQRWRHQGPQERAKFYGHLRDAPKATFLLNTCTVEGQRIAVEYSFSYGDVPMVGGICIMEHAAERISAVRIADDVGA